MNKKFQWAMTLAAVLLSMAVWSGPAKEPENAAAAKIRATLEKRYPRVKISQIEVGPMPGLYELVTDAGIAYTDANADYLFLGKILDTKTQEDLTETRWNAMNAIEFDKLPFDMAIKFVKGNGKRHVAVFEDPHCPFCRQLEGELQKVSDITLYVFLFPIESLHPGATQTSRNIWCAKDRASAWTHAMVNNEKPAEAKCEGDTLNQLIALGDKLNVNATPTLFFADGRRHAGAMPAEQLEKELNATGKK